jgi:predicted hydrocarbon binding protein
MPNRVERILRSIMANAGKDVYERLKNTCGETDVKAILAELDKACGTEGVARVMKPCGYQCISNNMIRRARAIYKASKNLEDFLRLMNDERIGGGKLHLKDGKIIGIYEKCYCGLAKKVKDLSPLFCYCSEGWYERLFSSVFEKPVEVKKVRTILDGSDKCVFEIVYQE